MARDRRAALWLRGLVRLYPPAFRKRERGELARVLEDGARDAARRGRAALTRYVMVNTAWCLRDAATEWWTAPLRGGVTKRRGGGMSTHDLIAGLRAAARALVRYPGYSVPALLTLALGIGANTAMFSVLYGVLLRPLPYPEPERLVELFPADRERGDEPGAFSVPDVRDWQERSRTLSAMGAYTTLPSDLVLTGGDDAEEVETAYVTTGFFETLGVAPLLGRTLPPEAWEGDNRVVVASHAFWSQHLGGDPRAVGRVLPLSGSEYRLVGVMPESFGFPDRRVRVWTFLSVIPQASIPFEVRGVRFLRGVGRLAGDATPAGAREELSGIAASLAATYPDSNQGVAGAAVRSLRDGVVGDVRTALLVLMAAALLILTIVCANVANLALAREARREPELAVRAALGASRRRRAALVIAESLLLSLVGGALGLALAAWGTGALVALNAGTLPRADEIGPDWRVAAFSMAASVAVGAAFAFLPGLRAGRADLAGRLRAAGRGSIGAGRARGVLVVSQVALSVVLLVGAVLLGRSLQALGRVDPGFDTRGLVVADMTFAASRFPDRAAYLEAYDRTLEALAALPGARSVATIRRFPFRGVGEGVHLEVPGAGTDPADGVSGSYLAVSPGVFETLGIRVLEGSGFASDAGRDGRNVAVVSRSLARAAFGSEPAVGRTLVLGEWTLEVVGMAADVRQTDLDAEPVPTLYLPQHGFPRRGAAFAIRADGDPDALLGTVRAAVRRLDPLQAITELTTAEAIVHGETLRPRFFTLLLGAFASLALVLSGIGVYGVVAFGVAQRRREVGIRVAMGADPRRVHALVVRQGMAPVMGGIVVGGLAAAALVRSLASLLFEVGVYDPLAYALGVGVLAAAGLAACWVPARAASRAEPVRALASE